MAKRSTPLRVEELESRVALSASHPALDVLSAFPSATPLVAPSAHHPHHEHHHPHHEQALRGTIRGTYTVTYPPIPDVGPQYHLSGAGTVRGLGPVTASGTLNATGFIANGRAAGDLTLANAAGTVTLHLVGPVQGGFAPLPEQFHFTVVSATGAYQGLQASGTADLRLSPPSAAAGTFTLTLHPGGPGG
jgi:hypothetical protein